ncbi:MAG: extracellular solute-binding protein [Lachnospiraceae bacterium]|jgi:multiple sugar transport system substrate-binding protein|nr:extracellular solute-binding protein [Lachnospiraceae bacterium]
MKKRAWMLCIGLVLTLLVAACGKQEEKNSTANPDAGQKEQKTDQQTSSDEPVKVNIWLAGSGDAAYDEAYRTIFDAYCNEHTNVSYELTFISWSDYFTKLNTGLVGGAGPDLYMLGYGQMGSVQALGYTLALNDYIPEEYQESYYPNILNAATIDGNIYGLLEPATRPYFYRKDIAAANEVTEEELTIKTPEDFYNLVRKMTVYDDNGKVVTYGLEIDPDGEQEFFALLGMYKEDARLWNDDTTAAFDSPEAVQAVEGIRALVDEGYVCLRDPSATSDGLTNGISAMALSAESAYVNMDAAFPGNVGVVKSDMTTLLIGNFLAVNSESKNKETAADMLMYMFNEDSGRIKQEKIGQFASMYSLEDAYLEANPNFENVIYSYQHSRTYSDTMTAQYTELITGFRTGFETMIRGADAASELKSMAEAWNALIQ